MFYPGRPASVTSGELECPEASELLENVLALEPDVRTGGMFLSLVKTS